MSAGAGAGAGAGADQRRAFTSLVDAAVDAMQITGAVPRAQFVVDLCDCFLAGDLPVLTGAAHKWITTKHYGEVAVAEGAVLDGNKHVPPQRRVHHAAHTADMCTFAALEAIALFGVTEEHAAAFPREFYNDWATIARNHAQDVLEFTHILNKGHFYFEYGSYKEDIGWDRAMVRTREKQDFAERLVLVHLFLETRNTLDRSQANEYHFSPEGADVACALRAVCGSMPKFEANARAQKKWLACVIGDTRCPRLYFVQRLREWTTETFCGPFAMKARRKLGLDREFVSALLDGNPGGSSAVEENNIFMGNGKEWDTHAATIFIAFTVTANTFPNDLFRHIVTFM